MKYVCLILVFSLLTTMLFINIGVAEDHRDAIITISQAITNLYNQDANIREMSANVLVAQGDAAIPYLRNVLRGRRCFGSAVAFSETVKILENIGTTNAIIELLSIIGDNGQLLTPDVLMKRDQRLMGEYPAYASVVRIGEPAVYCIGLKLIDKDLMKSRDKYLYLRALRQISGEKAKHVLEEYIKSLELNLSEAKLTLQFLGSNAPVKVKSIPSVANSESNSVSP